MTIEEQLLLDSYLQNHVGQKGNPLTGKTFEEILEIAKSEIQCDQKTNS